MKGLRNFKALIVLVVVTALSSLSANEEQNTSWDTEADKQIIAVASSSVYANEEVLYSYAGQNWHIRVIRCPNKERLVSGPVSFGYPFCLLTHEPVPDELFAYLQKLTEKPLESIRGKFFSNGSSINGHTPFEWLANPHIVPAS